MRSLLRASRTSIWHTLLRRSANDAVNFSGMCCTITMPGHTLGSAVSTASSAWVPPVEVPMATIRSVVWAMAWPLAAGRIASALSLPAGAGAGVGRALRLPRFLTLEWAAARIAATNSGADSIRKFFKPVVGLVMTSTAPADSACREVSAPFWVSEEQITTGVGRSLMILRRKVMPSMRGISTSSTITSGHSRASLSMAKIGSEAAPMTWMSGVSLKIASSTWRTTAESSTSNTLIFLEGMVLTFSHWLMPDPDVAVPQVEHNSAIAGTAHVLGREVQIMALGEGQRREDVQAGHIARRHVHLRGEHLAAAEHLYLIILWPRAVGARVLKQQLQRFVTVFAIQWLINPHARRQHEMAHAADQPLRVPEGERHAGSQQRAQACRPRHKADLAWRQDHLGGIDRLFHGLR